MTSLLDSVVHDYTSSLATGVHAYPYGDDVLVDLPMTYADGRSLSVLVTDLGGGIYNLTDRESTVDVLTHAGVNLGDNAIGRSFAAIRDTVDLPPLFGREASPFEISGLADSGDLSTAIHSLVATMLRADGLRAVGARSRRLGLGDRVIKRASAASLTVVPKAPLATKFGGKRQVTAKVIGGREVYIQAIGTSGLEAYDHTRALFGYAAAPADSLTAVVADGVTLEKWQRNALGQDGLVIDEAELEPYLKELALAA